MINDYLGYLQESTKYSLLYHGSNIQNMIILETKKGKTVHDKNYKLLERVYAGQKEIISSAFTFQWSDKMGLKFGTIDGVYTMKIPKKHISLTSKPCSIYSFYEKPLAVIVKGNPKYVTNNPMATKLYREIRRILEKKGYIVEYDPGLAYTSPTYNASIWLGHSRGVDRLQYAPPGIDTLEIKTIADGPYDPDHYKLSSDDIKNLNKLTPYKFLKATGGIRYEYFTYENVKINTEVKYKSAMDCMKQHGIKIEII